MFSLICGDTRVIPLNKCSVLDLSSSFNVGISKRVIYFVYIVNKINHRKNTERCLLKREMWPILRIVFGNSLLNGL